MKKRLIYGIVIGFIIGLFVPLFFPKSLLIDVLFNVLVRRQTLIPPEEQFVSGSIYNLTLTPLVFALIGGFVGLIFHSFRKLLIRK